MIGISISVAVFLLERRSRERQIRQSFEWVAREHIASLTSRLEGVADVLSSVRAFVRSSRSVEADEFEEFTAPPLARLPERSALGLVTRVNATQHEERFVVRLVEPAVEFAALRGFDLASDAEIGEVFRQAGTADRVVVKQIEVPSAGGGGDLLAVLPIRRSDASGREELSSFAFALFRAQALVTDSRGAQQAQEAPLRLQILDDSQPNGGWVIYSEPPGPTRADMSPELRYVATTRLGDAQWRVVATSDASAWHTSLNLLSWGLFGAGLLITLTLAAYLRQMLDRRTLVEGLVRERTDQLTDVNRALRAEIVERQRAEIELSNREDRISGIMQNVQDGIITIDEEGRIESFNQAAECIFALQSESVVGQPFETLLLPAGDEGGSDGHVGAEELLRDAIESTGSLEPRELTARLGDGSAFPIEVTIGEMSSATRRLRVACVRDISVRKETERQLHQAQKMETIGQLTGGIAHDFNNLLTIVLGNLELLGRRCGSDAKLMRHVEKASRAAQRGAELTQRLLAFSRRQPLQPAAVDVTRLVSGAAELLRRTLGTSIRIRTKPAADLWLAQTDAGQLENSLLNLGINARDAMPHGGELVLEARNTHMDEEYAGRFGILPGSYVQIAVTDTGIGMPPDVVDRAFDPFFTTKEPGKGTGLGLSMVHGFVKQCGGHLRIYSEPGRGTTVRLYLPRAGSRVEDGRTQLPDSEEPKARGETVLLAEDDADAREVASEILCELGYRVLGAKDAASALELFGERSEIDVLLTDVVMPGGMSGVDLARALQERDPSLPVVYCSGYSEYAIFREGQLGPREKFLVKPYSRRALAEVVRAALDSEVKE